MTRIDRAILLVGAAMMPVLTLAPASAQDAEISQGVAETARQLPLFALVYRAGPAWKPGRPISEQGLRPHGAYMKKLFDEGHIFAAGPLGPDGGLVLLHAGDLAEAEELMRADPAITAGIFSGEVRRWQPLFRRDEAIRDPG